MTGGRAARIIAVAVTVFLCFITLSEYVSLRLELQVPVLQIVSGEDMGWMKAYRKKESGLDASAENELLTEKSQSGGAEAETDGATENGGAENEAETKAEDNVAEAGSERGEAEYETEGEDVTVAEDADDSEADGTYDSANENATASRQEAEEEKANQVTPAEEAEFPYYIKINRQQNCVTIYTLDEDGEYTVPCKAMICSTGLYNATPQGVFHISTKYLWRELYGGVYGQYATRITGGILFHSVPYYSKAKNTLCTDKYNKLGQQASMGCVRLTVEDAKWIAENCPSGTAVEIYDDEEPGPLGKPEAAKIDTDSPNKGWDPTDPDEANPWNEISKDN